MGRRQSVIEWLIFSIIRSFISMIFKNLVLGLTYSKIDLIFNIKAKKKT
jgi:hypothetical protein